MRDHQALLALTAERARTPFAWGRNDCVTFAADAVRAQTGRDPLKGLRGRWRSRAGALRVLRARGGLEAAVRSVMGAPIAPAMAARGDVALVPGPEGDVLAIVEGETLVGPDLDGLRRLPRAAMSAAWAANASGSASL